MAQVALSAPVMWTSRYYGSSAAAHTLNANGEYCAIIGHVHLQDGGAGGSRTISAAGGGRIFLNTASSITWATGTTVVVTGIQDVDAAGLPDTTFDVSASWSPGTETFANNTLYNVAMESGSKTLSQGQLIAIVVQMTNRGGTDQLTIDAVGLSAVVGDFGVPYGVLNGSFTTSVQRHMILFDDATVGWITFAPLVWNTAVAVTSINFNSGSTPDEYAAVVSFDAPMTFSAIGVVVSNVATADPFEVIWYTDPFGSPSAAVTFTPDPDQMVDTSTGILWFTFTTPITVTAGAFYAAAVRPTSANNITISHYDLTSGFDGLKAQQPWTTIQFAARTNQTGAFVETQAYHLPWLYMLQSGVDDGTGGGGGTSGQYAFVA